MLIERIIPITKYSFTFIYGGFGHNNVDMKKVDIKCEVTTRNCFASKFKAYIAIFIF